MFMVRRDTNKDLFCSLSNTNCKNTPVIPALRLLAQTNIENPFHKTEYLCSHYLYLWAELFALALQLIYLTFYTTRKYGRVFHFHGQSLPLHQTAQQSTAMCDNIIMSVFSRNWTDIFISKMIPRTALIAPHLSIIKVNIWSHIYQCTEKLLSGSCEL